MTTPNTGKITTGGGLSGPGVPTPSVCRMVHYQSYGTPGGEFLPEPRAAVITEVNDNDPVPAHGVPNVSLCVLNPTGMYFNQNGPFAAEPTPGHWNWPPRV